MDPITRSSEHAIRALTFLAQRQGNGFSLVRDMARELGIPAPYLEKVLKSLVARGYLLSQRGRNGGFRLSPLPKDVTLFQIVSCQEKKLANSRKCFLGQADCSDERACPMHDFWKGASGDFLERLERTTLADMVRFCSERPDSGYPSPRR